MKNKQIKDIHCKGYVRGKEQCQIILYQTDGDFIYVNGSIFNESQREQKIKCGLCGYTNSWSRNGKFISKTKFPTNKFERKF